MRLPLLSIPILSVAVVASFGCTYATEDSQLSGQHLRNPPAAGSTDEHDANDTQGATAPDAVNPNATTAPAAPVAAGVSSSEFALALGSSTPVVGLGDTTTVDVTVQPKNGFTSPVSVTVSGLPDGATAAPITVTPGTPGKLVIKTDVTAVPTAPNGSAPIVVTGTSGAVKATANANFKIAPKLTLTIPVNIDALRAASTQYRDEWGPAFGQNQQALRTQQNNGIVVTVFNADSKPHIIHGANGFAHGNTAAPIQPNAFELTGSTPRTRTLSPGVNCNGYPHDGSNGQGASFRIKVDAVQ